VGFSGEAELTVPVELLLVGAELLVHPAENTAAPKRPATATAVAIVRTSLVRPWVALIVMSSNRSPDPTACRPP
jgi:hypothetical protein